MISRLVILLPLLILLGACEQEQAPPASPGTPAVTVVTLAAEPVTLTRQLPGRTTAFVVAEVRPQVTGIVKERLFIEGGLVEAGEPLYQLDDAAYRATYNSALASLARAEASAEIARRSAERAEELIESNSISTQEVDNAVAAYRQAAAEVGVAEAQVASAAVQLGFARITSPIDGRIGRSTVTQGALVTANQAAPLAIVQQLDPIYVDLAQSASELLELRRELSTGAIRQMQDIPVSILLEDGTRYAHKGQMAFADVAVDPMTGSYALRVIVPNPDQLLMPGMYVRAVVSNAILERGLLVPQQAISRDARGEASAMVVTPAGIVEERAIEVSRTVGDAWLVSSGLVEGDRVVVEGLQKIQAGMAVEATEAVSSAALSAAGLHRQ